MPESNRRFLSECFHYTILVIIVAVVLHSGEWWPAIRPIMGTEAIATPFLALEASVFLLDHMPAP
jgi:hypothetical protein